MKMIKTMKQEYNDIGYPKKTIRIFREIEWAVSKRFGRNTRINFTCYLAYADHIKSKRQYAHVFCPDYPRGNTICLTARIDRLPEKFIKGIIWHEFGHLIAGPESTETQASVAIWDYFGIAIKYSMDNKKLEYV